ncbi:MAG: helix-turn-helix transcriptional regulator [Candidatus Marinimicrobia bacterium]|nr:helix-turn-helix transcriptional regulator [Candidatus Neomarinimicrobiota bacterium]
MCDNNKCGHPTGRTPLFLQPYVLLLLQKKPGYGYEIIENLKQEQLMATKPDIGAIYRILRKLEKETCVESRWLTGESGPAKRIYTITPKGIRYLDQWAENIQSKIVYLNRFLSEYEKTKKEQQQ